MPFEEGKSGNPSRQFKPGQSGNPNGRPKKLPDLDELLSDILSEEKNGMTAAEVILKKIREKAAKGDLRAAEILLDRAYGKPKQSHELTGKDGKDLVTQVTVNVIDPKVPIASRESDINLDDDV